MNNNLLNILANSNKDIDNQQLMDYVAGKLSVEEAHAVERLMADNDFINDAVEGLQAVDSKKNINNLVTQLNKDLQKKVEQKKIIKEKRKLKEFSWLYFTIIFILFIIIITYFFLNKIQHP